MDESVNITGIDNEKTLAIMAHDIKAPLSTVVSLLDVINKGYVDDPAKIRELVFRASRKAESLVYMIDDILDYTLLSDKSRMKRQAVQLADVFKESLSTMIPHIQERNIKLEISQDSIGKGHYVSGNYTFLLRALNNIIMNAIKYNKENGSIFIECREDSDAGTVTIKVGDTGIGIPHDEFDKVFHIFERGRYARKNIDGSLGLGLSLVKQIIGDHDGQISLTSTVGVGTTVSITLPVFKKIDKERPMKQRILVVEDDTDVLEASRVVLEHNQYEVLAATTVGVAKETLDQEKIDLILLDVMMEKDSDGFDFAQYVKGDPRHKHIPIIMATAVNQRTRFKFDIEKDGDFLPVEKFMEKPIDPDDLIATIRGLLK